MRNRKFGGFTLIETVTTLSIIALVSVGLITISNYLVNRAQTDTTIDHMNQLRRAVSGNPVIVVNEARTSFGFLGDMGRLPNSLEELWVKGTLPAFDFNDTLKTGAGWNGPYLEIETKELASAMGLDGWGNAFVYSNTQFTDSTFGATVLGRIISYGADLASGGSDDITINFFKSETASRVQGFVKDSNGDAVPGVAVSVNYASNGTVATTTVYSDDTGYYFAPDIPFGNRSITIDPKLVLAAGTTDISGNANQNVKFSLKNFSSSAVSVASITLEYTVIPDAWFTQIKVGNSTVFNYSNPDSAGRFGTGDTKTFTAQAVAAGGGATESIQIRLQSPVTDVADLTIGDVGQGTLLQVELNGFSSTETGTAVDVDVTGISIEATFKNGSGQIVGAVVIQP